MAIAFIGLGANLDSPLEQVEQAIKQLRNHDELQLIKHSSLYKSTPIGQAGQPDYINAVAKVSTNLSPEGLLDTLLNLETQMGRQRDGTRWGPRVIDLDLLYYDEVVLQHSRLTLPHPEITNRVFVLYPLFEIEPHFVLPGGQLLSNLLDKLPPDGLERITTNLIS